MGNINQEFFLIKKVYVLSNPYCTIKTMIATIRSFDHSCFATRNISISLQYTSRLLRDLIPKTVNLYNSEHFHPAAAPIDSRVSRSFSGPKWRIIHILIILLEQNDLGSRRAIKSYTSGKTFAASLNQTALAPTALIDLLFAARLRVLKYDRYFVLYTVVCVHCRTNTHHSTTTRAANVARRSPL